MAVFMIKKINKKNRNNGKSNVNLIKYVIL